MPAFPIERARNAQAQDCKQKGNWAV